MGMTEFRAIVGIWLLAQIFIAPFIIIDSEKFGLVMDFGALVLMIVMYLAFKLMGA